ncbi:class I SAM-dependent methyltransferase [Paenibacillus hamazuiensis]|uniref:class I SAM-dependent methyltransferase n=1 Tax=Paenibacillus hamazuiensis TaxID=2936508 RepID=UPI00200F3A8B|nr:class I SAM-dependent methyltransferase [Paenibacillus hamazuiensis]
MHRHSYHDVLALLGESSAHPGGFAATVKLLSRAGLRPGMKVLDAGCGTGRTACYVAEQYGCEVTGIDRHPLMIEKARRRAELAGIKVEWVCGDVRRLPFPDASFDAVLIESVTVFVPGDEAIREYARVTKPGGQTIDLELCARGAVPQQQIAELYGAAQLPSAAEWTRLYENGGFAKVRLLRNSRLSMQQSVQSEIDYPDRFRLPSDDALRQSFITEALVRNSLFLAEYGNRIGFVAIRAVR